METEIQVQAPVQVPEWAQAEKKRIIYDPNLPVRYQFDGSEGVYRSDSETFDSLIIQPLLVRTVQNSIRYGREAQTWMDLAFVDESGMAAILSLNKNSINKMSKFFGKLQQDGIPMQAIKLVMQSEKVTVKVKSEDEEYSGWGSYFVVLPDEFEFVQPEDFEAANDVIQRFIWNLIGEVRRA